MKIAIMTFYEPNAYGMVLQAAALRHYLISLGHEADVIRYVSDGKVAVLPSGSPRAGFIAEARLILKNDRNPIVADTVNAEGFERFRQKHLTMTDPCVTLSDLEGLNEKYDAFICGSGGIWSAASFDPHMFLDFVKDPGRMIAYAPSFLYEGNEDDLTLRRIGELIRRFEHMSVREETGRRLMNDYYGIHTEEVADPVLLLEPEDWKQLLGDEWVQTNDAQEPAPETPVEEMAQTPEEEPAGEESAEVDLMQEAQPETEEIREEAVTTEEESKEENEEENAEEMLREEPPASHHAGGYLLTYFLSDQKSFRASALNLAQREHLEVRTIPFRESDLEQPGAIRDEVDPARLVNLVREASYVCTDCYHVALLSILFHRELCCFNRFRKGECVGLNARMVHILDAVGLLGRLYDDNTPIEQYLERTDYIPVQYKLEALRLKSRDFLSKSLSQVNTYTLSCSRSVRHVREIYSLCCGCGACVGVCPSDAISLKKTPGGFLEAVVDENLCRRCGRCSRVCPMRDARTGELLEDAAALSYSDEDEAAVAVSDGGGLSFRLSRILRDRGWAVTGCIFNEKRQRAEHVVVLPEGTEAPWIKPQTALADESQSLPEEEETDEIRDNADYEADKDPEELLRKIQGVKLMQSDLGGVWHKLEALSCPVLFFGTPCQCAAARKRFPDREDIFYVDLVCSGVPTDLLLARYISAFRGKSGAADSIEVAFRARNRRGKEVVRISDGTKVRETPIRRDSMARVLATGACSGEFCYDCRWRDRSCADLRLGSADASCLERFETDISMKRVAEEKKPAALDKGTFGKRKNDVTVALCMTPRGKNLLDMLMVDGYWEGLHKQDVSNYLKAVRRKNNPKPVYYAELMETLRDERVSIRKLLNEYVKPIEKRSKAIERLQTFTHAGRAAVNAGERAGKRG